jgi:mRNA-degrading endonuclease RelE of RelBE toxin-antitoxin system
MLQSKIDEMGTRLDTYPHKRLLGRPEFKLRVGDYRLLYELDVKLGRIISITWEIGEIFTSEVELNFK